MNVFRNLLQQLKTLWTQSSAAQRAAMATAAVLIAAGVVGVGVWSARPQYVMLASGLTPHQTADLAARLDAKSVPYKMSFSGSAVKVRKSDYNTARVAASDLISPGGAAPVPIGVSILDDPSLNGYRMERRLEESLARTIMQFDAVELATVHIGKPPSSPFAMQQEEVTASVVLQMRSNANFSSRQAAAIVATVSQGVEGLLPENVTVTDTHGRILSNNSPGGAAHIVGQLEYRQRVESDLAANAELLLSQLVGFGHAVVRVSAEIDFDSRTSEETSFDPNGKVRKTEKIDTTEQRGTIEEAEGPTGATPNLSGGGSDNKGRGDSLKKETIESTYENAMTFDKIYQAAGKIKRLTVAAVVDLGALKDSDQAAEITPEKIEGIIKQAVGFNASRQDEIELLIAPLAAAPADVPPVVASPWRKYEALVRAASLGLAALVALVLGTLTLRKVQLTAPAPAADAATLDTRRTRALASMSDAVRRNPDQLKDALQLWLSEDDNSQSTAEAA